MLTLIPLLLMTAIALCFYGGVVKLAACILHFSVTWKSSLLFALLMFTVFVLTRGIMAGPIAFSLVRLSPASDPSLPVEMCQMFVIAIIFVALGGWFFRKRVTGADGRVLGWPESIRLSALALSLIVALGVVALVVVSATSSYSNVQP